jgi:hypothetical protein
MNSTTKPSSLAYVGPCPCCGERLEARVPNNRKGRRILAALRRAARERSWEKSMKVVEG